MDGQGFRSPADGPVDSFTAKPITVKAHGHVPDGAVVVPDPNLIFNGEFKRAGLDLVLSHDGHEFVVHDYFRGDKRAAIASPDGAHLSGDIVNALTGHVQYAQAAGGIAAAQIIGHVTKLSGSATAVRNGVSVILNNGDNVEKGDVVSTGGDSTLGITFIDGTVFGLSSNARMVLNEMVYDPNGSSNSSLLSLVAGTITFVAGETAKHGDMKIDTPVATMGIRGTAVLTQINFVVPAGGGDPQPQASFQVLVEPNGTTGSYILFDKVTLLPIATVNQAGQMIQISGGNVSITNALMSPDIQKLISDVFTLKFTDNNTNTKLTTNFTDTITPTSDGLMLKTQGGYSATAVYTNTTQQGSDPGHNPGTSNRIPGPPDARSLDANGNVRSAFSLTERADKTGDTVDSDTVSGRITFVDQNLGDRPTVSVNLAGAPNYVYKSAGQQDVTGSLTDLQKQDIAATQIQISVVPDGANANNGSAVWTYTIPDHVFDFLAAGETLTLTYMVRVDNNFSVNPETTFIPITITITGTNDKPVITTSVPVITFEGGTSVPGGPLNSDVPTSGTLNFDDVDLTDKHTVSVALTSATLPDGTVPPGPLAAFQSAMSVAIAAGADSTGDGTGTINWSLADLPVYLADFIPKNAVLTLVYTVTLTDSQGATSQQTITVTITGTDAPAVVWIATDKPGVPSGGFWKDAGNWATGTVPTINDDVIVITDQLHGLTPSYPVTIDTAAYAKSITMNDFGGPPPKVINQSSLTISGALNMSADSIFFNVASGTMSVGGKAEILNTAVFNNAGYLTLRGGGDFAVGTTITNSGTIELSGGTLKTLATIHNAGGTLKADAGTTLIVDAATVDGGTLTVLGTLELDGTSLIENGALNNSGTANVKGAVEFAHETVSNTATGLIKVLANGWLTIHQGSGVTNTGNITVDAAGKLTVNGATISGAGTVTDNGEIDLTGNAVLSGGTLKNNAIFNVSGTGNALHNEAVTNAATGTIEVLANGALIIDQGSSVTNTGNVTVDAAGKLTVNGATISGAGTVTDSGEIDLTGSAALSGGTLNNNATVKVSGTGNALHNEAVTNSATGTIEVLANGALAIDQGSVVTNTGNLTVDATGTLTLADATITGGTVNGSGTIDVTGASKIDGGATLSTSTVIVDAQLTLDGMTVSGSTITDKSSIVLTNTVQLKGGATIQGASAALLGAITNNGTLEIAGAATLLNDVVTNGGTVKVDGGQTLTLSGTEISGGAINGSGTIDVTGASKIDGGATLSTSTVIVDAQLTLDGMTVSGSTITDKSSIVLANTVQLKGGATIQGASAALLGAITNNGTLEIAGAATLLNDVVTNGGTVKIDDGQTLTLSGTEISGGAINGGGTIDVTGASKIDGGATLSTSTVIVDAQLTLDGMTVSGSTITDKSSIVLANTVQLKGGATIQGASAALLGAITNNGTLEIAGAATLLNDVVTNTGTVKVDGGQTLTLSGTEISGGTVNIAGTLESIGTNAIDDADINVADTGTISVTSGTLTIDLAVSHTITNHNLIQVSDGVLEISGEWIVNAADLKAVDDGILKLTSLAVDNEVGTVTVGEGAKLYLSGVTINDGSLDNSGNLYAVSGLNTITAVVANAGVIEVQAGTLDLAGGITGAGEVIVDLGATLEFSGAIGSVHIVNSGSIVSAGSGAAIHIEQAAGSVIDNNATIGPAVGQLTSTTDAIVVVDGSITINNFGHINGNISVATATFNNNAGGTWTVAGTSVFGNASTIVNHGDIDLHGIGLNVASISVTGLGIENDATINSWGTASITGDITNTDTGSIEVHTGTLTLFGSLSGSATGSVIVDALATLVVKGTVEQTITLAGDGAELRIDAGTFGGSIAELSVGDKIDLSSIVYDDGTSATYNAATHELVVSDAYSHTITLRLAAGVDYSNYHFAGSDDGTGHTLITINANDDAPVFDTATAKLTASVSEQPNATGDSLTLDPTSAATGSIDFRDVDLTDLPTVTNVHQVTTSLAADSTDLTTSLTTGEIAALQSALTYQQTGKNNGAVTWHYSIADNALDFLAKGQTATVVSTITLDDHQGHTTTADVTVTVTGANDAPTLAPVTTGPLVDTAVSDSFPDITGTLVGADADHGETATLKYAVLDATNHPTTTVAGHYGSLTVNDDGTYDYVPDAAAINALSAGSYADTFTVQTTDAQNAVGTATFKVNVTGANDAPTIAAASSDSAGGTANEANAGLDKTGTLTLSDLDATDHVSVSLDHVTISLEGHLQADGVGSLSNMDLLNYFTVPSGEILNGTANHAQFGWEFNSGDQAFDFLAAGQTLSLQYTIVPDDGHAPTGTGNGVVTIIINGTNDAPTLDSTTLASVVGNDSDPAGSKISDLFATKFHDVDANASLKAIGVTSDAATTDQGVWQYELGGSWVDIGSVSDTQALVLSSNTLIRFVPANGFSGTPGALDVHALDDTYTGTVTTTASAATIDITNAGIGHGGTTPVSDLAASIGIEVTPPPDILVANDDTIDNSASPLPADGWVLDPANGHYYRFVSMDSVEYGTAATNAANDGAYLATITSADENSFVHSVVGNHVGWLGGTTGNANSDGSSDGTTDTGAVWSWTSGPENGTLFSYTNWGGGEPNGGFGSTSAVVLLKADGSWNDAPPWWTNDQGYVEEWGGQAGQVAFRENTGATLTTAQLLANDTHSASNPITVTSVGGLSAHGGTVALNGNIITYSPATDYFGADSFTYTISDGVKTSTATVSFTVDQSPVIDTSHVVHTHNENNSDTLTGLSVSGPSDGTYSLSAVTAGSAVGSSVALSQGDGLSLNDVNTDIANVTYTPGPTPPANDMIAFTVTDSHGVKDTVNLIFNVTEQSAVTLTGTTSKDVFFGTNYQDQFVFAANSNHDVIVNFTSGEDHIDLSAVTTANGATWLGQHTTQVGSDTLITIDAHDSILLKNVAQVQASDFIFHA
ncbi:VCBS repeat-containing protein [Bradyrhizobium betae]|nr:VCBS repeat-containing protein [Bradyrhizobium betae]